MTRPIPPRIQFEPISRWKYRTTEDYVFKTGFNIGADFDSLDGYLTLTEDGLLFIQRGYLWDGPSGPALDTPSGMTSSCVHDAFYQLMRGAKPFALGQHWRRPSDKLLREISEDHGMWPIRAKSWEWFVNVFGKNSARKAAKRISKLKKRHGLK